LASLKPNNHGLSKSSCSSPPSSLAFQLVCVNSWRFRVPLKKQSGNSGTPNPVLSAHQVVMPLFVSILRHAMLFLNIYDSYKVLKTPPPSVRHGGQPSQRALTQRKRDMKGCLAVWIVWVRLCRLTSSGGRHLHLTVLLYDI
jgi:hypothetical protein